MAAGFRSPVLPLGISATTAQGGYQSLLGFWMGGAGVKIEKLGGPKDHRKLEQMIREDEEITVFLTAWVETIQ